MTSYQLRGHGQIWSGDAGTPLDGLDWQNVLVFTTTTDVASAYDPAVRFGYGQQIRYGAAMAQSGGVASIPDSDVGHAAFTIPKNSPIIIHAGLGYKISTDGKVIQSVTDAIHSCRVRLVKGFSGSYTPITGWEFLIPDNTLTAYFSMPPGSVAGLGLPAQTAVPILSDIPNGDGNYVISYTRTLRMRVVEEIAIALGEGFAVQMKNSTRQRGFEYDVQVPVILT